MTNLNGPDSHGVEARAQPTARERAEIVDACAQLQQELDALMGGQDADNAVQSLDTAVASLKEVEHRNVSSVQLVALTDS